MQEQVNRRKASKNHNRRKGRNGGGSGNRGSQPGNRSMNPGNSGNSQANGQNSGAPGVCVRCGHPAPDGKLCNFHKSLLNSIRNDSGNKRTSRTPIPPSPNAYC
jgi:hypothetical protein